MADQKVSQLPAATTVNATDLLYLARSGTQVSATVQQVAAPSLAAQLGVGGRASTQNGVAIPNADQVGATDLYLVPYNGGCAPLYTSAGWLLYPFSQIDLSLSGLTSGAIYDVFDIDNGDGTITIDVGTAWTNSTTRALGLTDQDGHKVNTSSFTSIQRGKSVGASRARLRSTIKMTGTGTTEQSTKVIGSGAAPTATVKQFVWNAYNREPFEFAIIEGTSTWTASTGNWAIFNGSNFNRFECVVGLDSVSPLDISIYAGVITSVTGYASIGLQEDGTGGGAASNQADSGFRCGVDTQSDSQQNQTPLAAYLKKRVPLGYHFYQGLQWALTANMTIIGTDTSNNSRRAGIVGTFWS